jgi:hypothetical protein
MQKDSRDYCLIIEPEVIVNEIEEAIKNNSSFSLIRFGDGGLKIIKGISEGEIMYGPWRKEGIPMNFFTKMLDLWAKIANEADYIDSPLIYFEDELHRRRDKTSRGTWDLMSEWQVLYEKIGINLKRSFCSPEIGHLLFCEDFDRNLVDIIKDKKICYITSFFEAEKILFDYVKKIDIKLIPWFSGNHYKVCFETTVEEIKREACEYDLWFVSAGELGRIYTGQIKEAGGRAVDLGKVIDAWVTKKLDNRVRRIVKFSQNHPLLFKMRE